MGIVKLEKEGKLPFDDKIWKHIPELSYYKGITIRHLLTHTSELPYIWFCWIMNGIKPKLLQMRMSLPFYKKQNQKLINIS